MNIKQVMAMQAANKRRILKVAPNCPDDSGIYVLAREEDGLRYAYIGKAKHLLTRLAQHLSGYQYIDLSLRKHGLWSNDNPTGYMVSWVLFPESELDEQEREYIRAYANLGYQLKNIESGGTSGKKDIGQRRPAKGYRDGIKQGEKNCRRFIADLFSKHLVVTTKGNPPTKLQEKALQKFVDFISDQDKEV